METQDTQEYMSSVKNFIFSIMEYFYSKIRFLYEYDSEETKKFIINQDHKPKIIINHISEESAELENYIQQKLEEFFLNTNIKEKYTKQESDNLESENQKSEQETKIPETLKQNHNEKIYVEYSLNNDNYAMCINGPLAIDKNSISNDFLQRRIITANLEGSIFTDSINVSRLIKEFQGPYFDFYKCINGTSKNLNDILYPYDLSEWARLKIFDIFGDETIIDLSKNKEIDWNTKFTF